MKLTKRQKMLVEYMKQKKDWVRWKDAYSDLGIADLPLIIASLERKGFIFETMEYQLNTFKTHSHAYKLKGMVEKAPEPLTEKQSEIVRYMRRKAFVRRREVLHIDKNFASIVKKLKEMGCEFEERTFTDGTTNGMEYRLLKVPKHLILTEPKKSKKVADKDNPKICRIAGRCQYGMSLSIAGMACNYLVIEGHCRPCLPGECKEKGVFKPKRKEKPKKVLKSYWDDDEGTVLDKTYELNAIFFNGGKKSEKVQAD